MIQVIKLSFGFPAKDLYEKVSFTIEAGQKCAFIGSNGSGKSTLVDMIIDPEKYLYDGKIIKDENCRIGYASQFVLRDKEQSYTVFEYLSQRFIDIQMETSRICDEMATAEDIEPLLEKYQELLDIHEAMDGDNYESNIHKELYLAGMTDLADTQLSQLSGGEYKLLQIMREMLLAPNLLVLDEPDVFLDFGNLNRLVNLINNYKGTMLVVTHNRYLLNHCFNKILHLENCDIQEFDGSYTEYRCIQLREKLRLKLQNIEEQEEIERTQEMVDILRRRATLLVNPVIGSAVNAKQTQLDRLRARQIKEPFIEIREPQIKLPELEGVMQPVCTEEAETESAQTTTEDKEPILSVKGYSISFEEDLLENVNFDIKPGEKVAIVGANGTGKTTLMSDILKNNHPAIHIDENIKYACLSQLMAHDIDESKTVYEVMADIGYETKESARSFLEGYCFETDTLKQKVEQLSGGEKNMLQLAMLANSGAELLILDEPTSHLDIYAQMALEKAVAEYKGAVLMVSHDFYLVANCADYVLLVENNKIRQMRNRNFRKMVYEKYFDQKYLAGDKKKQEIEAAIMLAFKNNQFVTVEKLCNQLEEVALGEEN